MYVPALHKEDNIYLIKDFIQENNFGTIISSHKDALFVTQTPFLVELIDDEKLRLYGHIALANDQAQSFAHNREVTCLFQGPHCYISPSWYVEPNVPTWNYKSAQVKGTVIRLEGKEAQEVMEKIFTFFEGNIDNPMKIKDIPIDTLNQDLSDLFAFEIISTTVEASFKLSQNKDDVSYSRIIRELKKRDDYNSMLIAFEMEQEMKRRRKTVKA